MLLWLLAGAGAALAAAPRPAAGPDAELVEAGFLSGHPDLRHRLRGMELYQRGDYAGAMRSFQMAARFADKAAQAMLAEMLWTGTGTAVDRPLAYVWIDLAAERGYLPLVAIRERYWEALGEDERARARREGPALQAIYHDGVARPRLAAVLRRSRGQMTGSRTGYTGNPLRIISPGGFGETTLDGNQFFDDRYWDPAQYQAWQDEVWTRPLQGRVEVGEAAPQPATAPVKPDPPTPR
ncbi:sel1 repeat family protein [Stenotrophomonas sp. YIM B06876]|uniref:sel1 repeat family protein n=1 Tax=Stenotrophomonas sp. YIM B06876 TaxID=3060211 RepID=UPI0027384623|nr:sel1 repeat family protein [Stenotrophomonas sp. YIM B06876]